MRIFSRRLFLLGIALSLFFVFGIVLVAGAEWNPPCAGPPGCQPDGPITTGIREQRKKGPLRIESELFADTLRVTDGASDAKHIRILKSGSIFFEEGPIVAPEVRGVVNFDYTNSVLRFSADQGFTYPLSVKEGKVCINGDCKGAWPVGRGDSFWKNDRGNIINTNLGGVVVNEFLTP